MRHCDTQALLNCWCVRTGIASAYFSVAMVKSHGRLYLVNRRGTARGHRLYFRSTYHEGQKARHEAETAMALKASQDKATPPLHFQGSPGCSNGVLRHWAHTVCKPQQPAGTVSSAVHGGHNPWQTSETGKRKSGGTKGGNLLPYSLRLKGLPPT
jgi:hypothetical protein